MSSAALLATAGPALGGALWLAWRRARRPRWVRLLVEPYRNDRASRAALLASLGALHSLLAAGRGRRRVLALEVHLDRRSGGAPLAWFALGCAAGLERHIEAALRASYPNVRLRALRSALAAPPAMIVMRRRGAPQMHAQNVAVPDRGDAPRADALLRAMAAAGAPATVQLVLRPASRIAEQILMAATRPDDQRLRAQAAALFWAEPRVLASDATRARAIASALRADREPPRLAPAHRPRLVSPATLAAPRLRRTPRRLYRADELAGLWQLPSPDFAALPCVRRTLPLAPAPPGISRPRVGRGLLRDEHGGVTIALEMRRQHTAVVGAVEQGKSSYLVASAKDDLLREDCAVIVFDPKGDAADAVLSVVPDERTCTLLDMAAPACGFNPLSVAAAPDAIADQVVGALRSLFSEGEVRGSSDRYLRNAVIAALACEPRVSLWDVARLLEVGPAGGAARAAAAERLTAMPAYAEVATFLAEELPVQLADARATTTAKLDAPANKLARVLNSPAVKRVLLNDSLRIDLDRVIDGAEVLVVRGALGEIGAGNVAVLMQLLLGMLDAALSRVQDRHAAERRRAVALKVDEAPLVINESFARTLALKRSAGLETVACWQADAQWPLELRDQLDALFAHRVLFATASAADARAASGLLLSEFSDQLRPDDEQAVRLATPDVRLHLPRHTAIVSWTTRAGRERPFIATTLPMAVDRGRIERHAERQRARGGRVLADPRPPANLLAPQPPPVILQSPPPAAGSSGSAPVLEEAVARQPRLGAARLAEAVRVREPPADSEEVVARELRLGAARASEEVPRGLAELRALDAAGRVRWLPRQPARARPTTIDDSDRELLEWLAAARCALTTQIHRRLRQRRALTTTQRQLKRLADAGLLARFQLHRADGGGVPQCCAVTDAAIELLAIRGRRAPRLDDEELPQLLADLHVVGWLLALEELAGDAVVEVLGPGRAAIAPVASRAIAPSDLELPPGVRARDFLTASGAAGERRPVERFAPVRPDAVVELRGAAGGTDLIVVRDRAGNASWLERYDHLLSGWWRAVPRYARLGGPPLVAVLCADARSAQERARAADALLLATLARIGEEPLTWKRPGRARIHFVGEADIHLGSLAAWRTPQHPPALRERAADPEQVALLELGSGTRRVDAPAPWR